MSSSGAKRSKSKSGTTKARSQPAKKEKSRRSKSKEAPKKRRAPATSSKKDSRRGATTSKPRTKKARTDDSSEETVGKTPKVSARKVIVKWKARTKWAVRKQPFRRLVNYYAQEKFKDMRLAAEVANAVQSAIEEETVEVVRQACMMALHAKRTTVNDGDILLQTRISSSASGMPVELNTDGLPGKRASAKGVPPKTSSQKRPSKEKASGDIKAPADPASATTTTTTTTAAVVAPTEEKKKPAKKSPAPKKSSTGGGKKKKAVATTPSANGIPESNATMAVDLSTPITAAA